MSPLLVPIPSEQDLETPTTSPRSRSEFLPAPPGSRIHSSSRQGTDPASSPSPFEVADENDEENYSEDNNEENVAVFQALFTNDNVGTDKTIMMPRN
jgi:hypothetical protein